MYKWRIDKCTWCGTTTHSERFIPRICLFSRPDSWKCQRPGAKLFILDHIQWIIILFQPQRSSWCSCVRNWFCYFFLWWCKGHETIVVVGVSCQGCSAGDATLFGWYGYDPSHVELSRKNRKDWPLKSIKYYCGFWVIPGWTMLKWLVS